MQCIKNLPLNHTAPMISISTPAFSWLIPPLIKLTDVGVSIDYSLAIFSYWLLTYINVGRGNK